MDDKHNLQEIISIFYRCAFCVTLGADVLSIQFNLIYLLKGTIMTTLSLTPFSEVSHGFTMYLSRFSNITETVFLWYFAGDVREFYTAL